MNRRSLFSAVTGFLAGLTLRPKADEPFDPTIAARDSHGGAITRIYRKAADGHWREIQQTEVKPGDTIIQIGQDGDRLWRASSTVIDQILPSDDGHAPEILGYTHTEETKLIA